MAGGHPVDNPDGSTSNVFLLKKVYARSAPLHER